MEFFHGSEKPASSRQGTLTVCCLAVILAVASAPGLSAGEWRKSRPPAPATQQPRQPEASGEDPSKSGNAPAVSSQGSQPAAAGHQQSSAVELLRQLRQSRQTHLDPAADRHSGASVSSSSSAAATRSAAIQPAAYQSAAAQRIPNPNMLPLNEPPAPLSLPQSSESRRPSGLQGSIDAANELTVPLERPDSDKLGFEVQADGLLNLKADDVPLRQVLSVLAQSQGLNILTTDNVDARISGTFQNITFQDAMDSVFALTDATWTLQGNVILVSKLETNSVVGPKAQGRIVRVFNLNYVSSADVQKVVTTLLSRAGSVAINEVSNQDSTKTREQIIVEDLPAYLERIEKYVRAIDVAPQQVMIEAHILEVDLQADSAHGVDFARLGNIAGVPISISTPSFNNTVTDLSTFAPPRFSIALLDGDKSSALIDALKKTTDAKTLASPKVMALNGQEASVQIGEKLGYFVTTSTDTASLQSVEFLETGVVLRVTPRITEDGRILMTVMPEVSDGSVDELGLPSERTTEVSTTLMLADGMGMVVGGLIRETDIDTQQRVPVLGSLWGVGKLFRRKQLLRERSEIVIALVPRIVHCPCSTGDGVQLQQATTPLFTGALEPLPRPWEPRMADAEMNPRRPDVRRITQDTLNLSPAQTPAEYFPTDDQVQLRNAPVLMPPPMRMPAETRLTEEVAPFPPAIP